jgi:hypothetical protein
MMEMPESLSRGIELAQAKDDLKAEIDGLTERDSAVLIIGRRWMKDGREWSSVHAMRRLAHHFESIGMLELTLAQMYNDHGDPKADDD